MKNYTLIFIHFPGGVYSHHYWAHPQPQLSLAVKVGIFLQGAWIVCHCRPRLQQWAQTIQVAMKEDKSITEVFFLNLTAVQMKKSCTLQRSFPRGSRNVTHTMAMLTCEKYTNHEKQYLYLFSHSPLFELFPFLTWAMTARAVPDICFVTVIPE